MKTLIILIAIMLAGCSNQVSAQWRGALITDKTQIDELAAVSNSFAFAPNSLEEITDMLRYNNGRLVPFIELSRYFWDEEKGLFEVSGINDLRRSIGREHIVIMLDEPFWRIRKSCDKGNQNSCQEIAGGYVNTQAVFSQIKYQLGYQMFHVEAYAELIAQKSQWGRVMVVNASDHVGFDCYGTIDNCEGHSQWEYGTWIYEAIAGTSKRIMLTVGAWEFLPIDEVINQIHQYFYIFRAYPDIFSGIGVFTWGSSDGINGARDIPALSNVVIEELGR